MSGCFAQRYVKRHGSAGPFRPKTSHHWQSDVFLKRSHGMMSEHRFPDTVQEHVFQGFSHLAGRNPAVPNSRVLGTHRPDPVRMRQNTSGWPPPKIVLESQAKMGGQKSA